MVRTPGDVPSPKDSPVRVDHLAQGELAAHAEVGLVVSQGGGRALHGVDLTVLLRLIQRPDELAWVGTGTSERTGNHPTVPQPSQPNRDMAMRRDHPTIS